METAADSPFVVVLPAGRTATVQHHGLSYQLRARVPFVEPDVPTLPSTFATVERLREPPDEVAGGEDHVPVTLVGAEELVEAIDAAAGTSAPVVLRVPGDHLDLDALGPALDRARRSGVGVEIHIAGR